MTAQAGVNQYVVHSEMCVNWGYDRLHELDQIAQMGIQNYLVEQID